MDVLKNIVVNWILPVVVAIAVYAGIQALRAPEVQTGERGEAPAFTLMSTTGQRVALADFAGQPVILNFWATWCGPCKAELPQLNKFAKQHPEVAMLGVALDSGTLPVLKRAQADLGIEFDVLRGNKGVQSQYGVRTIPTTFLVDASGVIQESHVGVVTAGQLARWVR